MSFSQQPWGVKVMGCPSQDLALTNVAFVSPSDEHRYVVPNDPEGSRYIELGGHVLSVRPHNAIDPGALGLNAIHRRNAKVSNGENIGISIFVPPKHKFNLVLLTVDVDFITKSRSRNEQLDASLLSPELQKRFSSQVFTVGQKVSFEYRGINFMMTILETVVEGQSASETVNRGMLMGQTSFTFQTDGQSGIKITNQKGCAGTNLFKHKEFNFQKLGIGGLDAEFGDIFRRAFASRVFPPHVVSKLGISHVKGMLLWGPPGTGKTLIARQIGKMLNGKEPKVVNGPEILNKFVGASEENVRNLFADAEKDQKERGDESDLHIIIFDEIDAICKSRGSTRDGTGVHDSIVNQLLTKIDGVDALNNILLIGMTNRKDLLDEALMRPGRLEVQIEIGLPDEKGRVQILTIHSSKMKENSFLSNDVDIGELATLTKNFSGAELEGLVKSATSFALNRQVNVEDLNQSLDEDNIKVTMDDFRHGLNEVKPAFGANVSTLDSYRLNGMLECGERHAHILNTCMTLVEQVKHSPKTPLLSCLLEGPRESGKTAIAATVAIDSAFPFVKMVSAESMVSMSETSKCGIITKVFDDAYKSALSIIVLDDIERLLEYVNIGPRFSNLILQTILVLLKRAPPKGRKLLVIGTTSVPNVMEVMEITNAFNVCFTVPKLGPKDIYTVLRGLNVFSPRDVPDAVKALTGVDEDIAIKKLLMLVEMAAQGKGGQDAEAVNAGQKTIEISHFRDCLKDLA